jgi:pimeloyl-ACP methyl ester carboxylesterase
MSSSQIVSSEIEFRTTQNITLRGTLTESHVSPSKSLVILLHGLNCDRNSAFLPSLAEYVASHGLSALRFDFPGSGNSDGDWSYANYEGEADCVQDAVTFAQSRDFRVVGILGHSKAATEVLIWAAKYAGNFQKISDIPKLVHVSGRFDLVQSPAGRFSDDQMRDLELTGSFLWLNNRVTKEAMAERNSLNLRNFIDNLDACLLAGKFLLVHCQDDVIIPHEDSLKLQQLRPEIFSELLSIPKGGHSYNNTAAKKTLFPRVLAACVSL